MAQIICICMLLITTFCACNSPITASFVAFSSQCQYILKNTYTTFVIFCQISTGPMDLFLSNSKRYLYYRENLIIKSWNGLERKKVCFALLRILGYCIESWKLNKGLINEKGAVALKWLIQHVYVSYMCIQGDPCDLSRWVWSPCKFT